MMAFSLTADGGATTRFARDLTIGFAYDPAVLGRIDEPTLAIHVVGGGPTERLPCRVDVAAHSLECTTGHFTELEIAGEQLPEPNPTRQRTQASMRKVAGENERDCACGEPDAERLLAERPTEPSSYRVRAPSLIKAAVDPRDSHGARSLTRFATFGPIEERGWRLDERPHPLGGRGTGQRYVEAREGEGRRLRPGRRQRRGELYGVVSPERVTNGEVGGPLREQAVDFDDDVAAPMGAKGARRRGEVGDASEAGGGR
jgi:hypothetical protein